ncbi:ribokinase [Roseibium limicola]|uniref:Ribokinase n=1 Tax=Roseibium limicola TaxID=2816037 RepID=A0A939EPH7_9HYPH|nr:ribokinase [Roseibium limicola]MBO0345677.1 ribokinase [Roseibium limicola]
MALTVFGSINLDLVVDVPRLPQRGETAVGPAYRLLAGGKGANQATAAVRAGAEVRFVGAVGSDAFADPALQHMRDGGVDLRPVRQLEGKTGVAFIGVETSGENQILVASGANAHVQAQWLEADLAPGDLLLLQGELRPEETAGAIELAVERGCPVVWNPAPVPAGDLAPLVAKTDVLIVNESEADELAERLGLPSSPEAFIDQLSAKGALVIVTLGANGILAGQGGVRYRLLPPPIEVVDTTGAGDAFCGAYCAARLRDLPTERALREAIAAGSLACTAQGAQTSAPDAATIQAMADRVFSEK